MIRKLTNHYMDSFCQFVKDVEQARSAAHVPRENTSNLFSGSINASQLTDKMRCGAFFFATDPSNRGDDNEALGAGDYQIAAYVQLLENRESTAERPGPLLLSGGISDTIAQFEARIVQVWYKPQVGIRDPQLPRDFIRIMERYAGSRGHRRIHISVTHFSLLIGYLAQDDWQIRSHGLRNPQSLEIEFSKELLPDYSGDPRNWFDLCKWYLDLSFGPVKRHSSEQRLATAPNILVSSFDIGVERLKSPAVFQTIPVVAVVVPSSVTKEDIKRASGFLCNTDAYRLVLCEDEAACSEIAVLIRESDQTPAIRYVDGKTDLLKALEAVRGYYFGLETDKSLPFPRNHLWQLYCVAKFEWNRNSHEQTGSTRAGAIVEIDFNTYLQLVGDRIKKGKTRELIFFNEPTFGETLREGDTLFFFVWDSMHNATVGGKERDSQPPGVIGAYAEIVKVERHTTDGLATDWERFGPNAIWDDKKFPLRYFSGDIIAFTLRNLVYHPCHEAPRVVIEGVPYNDLVRTVLIAAEIQDENRKKQIEDDARLYFPVWEVGNCYLSEPLVRQLREDLKGLKGYCPFTDDSRSKPSERGARETERIKKLVFIVYSGKEESTRETAKSIRERILDLAGDAFTVKLDQFIRSGDHWDFKLEDAAKHCDCVIPIVTDALFTTEYFLDHEWKYIEPRLINRDVHVTPIIISRCSVGMYDDFFKHTKQFRNAKSDDGLYLTAFEHPDSKDNSREAVLKEFVNEILDILR